MMNRFKVELKKLLDEIFCESAIVSDLKEENSRLQRALDDANKNFENQCREKIASLLKLDDYEDTIDKLSMELIIAIALLICSIALNIFKMWG
jgi:hypothetical protein